MTRRQKEPLRALTEEERDWLEKIAHARSEPIQHVIRAREILHVADGNSYTQAALCWLLSHPPGFWRVYISNQG